MLRSITALTAAIAVGLASVGAVAAQDEVCSSPDAPGDYYCRQILVTLVPDADIQDVVDRVVPGAEVGDNVGQVIEDQGRDVVNEASHRMWHVILPEGEDAVEARPALLADEAVEDVALGGPGELTGENGADDDDALPDTALAAPAPSGIQMLALGLLAMGVSLLTAVRVAARGS